MYNAIRYNSPYTWQYASEDPVIRSFGDRGTEAIFNGEDTKSARRTCPVQLWPAARRKLAAINAATSVNDLRLVPGNRYEPLKGDRKGQHSLRINDQYRIVFRWDAPDADGVVIEDYH